MDALDSLKTEKSVPWLSFDCRTHERHYYIGLYSSSKGFGGLDTIAMVKCGIGQRSSQQMATFQNCKIEGGADGGVR